MASVIKRFFDHCFHARVQTPAYVEEQWVVMELPSMTNDETRQKAKDAVFNIEGVEAVGTYTRDQTIVVIGTIDEIEVMDKLKRLDKDLKCVFVGPGYAYTPKMAATYRAKGIAPKKRLSIF